MRRRRSSAVDKARAQLTLLLTSARPERLASFTAAALARQYDVPIEEIERKLAAARQSRMFL